MTTFDVLMNIEEKCTSTMKQFKLSQLIKFQGGVGLDYLRQKPVQTCSSLNIIYVDELLNCNLNSLSYFCKKI